MSIAQKLGIPTYLVYLDEFGIDHNGYAYNGNDEPIKCFFKLYPWENLFIEIEQKGCYQFIERLLSGEIKVIEPPWKAILSNKGIWAFLWEQFPQSRYLLPTFFEHDNSLLSEQLRQSIHIRKPLIGREGASVSLIDPLMGTLVTQESAYGEEGYIIQDFCPPNEAMGYYPIIGSWFIDDACGFGIRCDHSLITSNSSIFVPHYYI
jgi:glutathionylspermidine synthase